MPYTIDKTGVAVANRIALEQHVLTGRLPGQVIFLNQGAFHRRGLRIRHNGVTDLYDGQHYRLAYPARRIMAYWGKAVYGAIIILTSQYDNLFIDYQAVGDDYLIADETLPVEQKTTQQALRLSLEDIIAAPDLRVAELALHTDSQTLLNVNQHVDLVASIIQSTGHV